MTRPWWRGLDVEVREALASWVPGADAGAAQLSAWLAVRLPGAVLGAAEGAELVVAWDGVAGRSEVRVLLEAGLTREADLARVMGRVLMQRAAGRSVIVALHGQVSGELAHALAVSMLGEDPVLDGDAAVVDLSIRVQRGRGSLSPARTVNG